MFQPKDVNKEFVLIKIDREKQRKKREMIGSLYIPPGSIHMNYNQQAGEIVMIGKKCRKEIPEMEIGDTLLFHHSVEGTVLSSLEKQSMKVVPTNNWCVYDNEYDDPFVYYVVREDYIYGVLKTNGEIHMHPNIVFAIPDSTEQDNRDLKRVGHLLLFKNFKEERANIEKKLQDLKYEAETHPKRAPQIMAEMEALTKSLNKKRAGAFMPVFVPPNIVEAFGVPLDVTYTMWYEFLGAKSTVPQVTTIQLQNGDKDYTFYVLRSNYILMVAKRTKEIHFTPPNEQSYDAPPSHKFYHDEVGKWPEATV